MFVKNNLFGKKAERDVSIQNNYNPVNSIYFKKSQFKRKNIIIISGICLFIIGLAVLLFQSYGYNVYYDGKSLGFVDNPNTVENNIRNINNIISLEKNRETILKKEKFSYEKGIRIFHKKEDLREIACAINEKCELKVKVYDVYIDGVFVAQDSTIDNYNNAISNIKKEYTENHPEDNYETIGFTQNVGVNVTSADKANSMTLEGMESILKSSLEIKTTSHIKEKTVIPYGIIYESTDVKNAGETEVKSPGVEGIVETTKLIEKHNGIQTASTDVSTDVLVEKVDQVVLLGTNGLQLSKSGMLQPTRGRLSSRMGQRWGRMHKGIDIAGNMNEPVLAPLAGTVIAAEYNESGYGNMVKIDHGNGIVTLYGHLNQINVNVNDVVHFGQLIGLMGNTGRSTGTHLHFEVILNGENVDPLSYVNYQ